MNFFNRITQNVATAKKTMPAPIKSGFFNRMAQNVATVKKSMPAQTKSGFFSKVAKNIATSKPIPAPVKQSLIKTMQQGKPLPAVIKKALATRAVIRKAVQAPAMVRKAVPTTMVRRSVPTAMVRKTVPQKSGLFANIKKLIQTTNPSVVKAVNPVQRSFMPVDLPYETMSKKQTAMRIPATNFAMPTNIDLVQPPVDSGSSNYYGK